MRIIITHLDRISHESFPVFLLYIAGRRYSLHAFYKGKNRDGS